MFVVVVVIVVVVVGLTHLSGGCHLDSERRVGALEPLEGEHGHLDADVPAAEGPGTEHGSRVSEWVREGVRG